MEDEDVTSIEGPVERIDGKLALRIPLSAGGQNLIECSHGISRIEGEFLCIEIPEWLAGMLRIEAGSRVHADNRAGKFNIQSVNPAPLQ